MTRGVGNTLGPRQRMGFEVGELLKLLANCDYHQVTRVWKISLLLTVHGTELCDRSSRTIPHNNKRDANPKPVRISDRKSVV